MRGERPFLLAAFGMSIGPLKSVHQNSGSSSRQRRGAMVNQKSLEFWCIEPKSPKMSVDSPLAFDTFTAPDFGTVMKTYLPKVNLDQRKWHVIDADGAVLGRLAVQVADLLRGRHKP